MTSRRPTQLHWFPKDPEKWLARTAHLSPEAHAAFDRLRCQAWLASSRGEPACTLTTDSVELARLSGLGNRWPRFAEKVLAMFTIDGGRLLDVDLYETWRKQHAGYDRRVNAGQKGVAAKALRKQSVSNADAKGEQLEQELEGAVERGSLQDPSVLPAPAPDSALALEGARAAVADERPADRASSRAQPRSPDRVPGEAPSTSAELTAAQHALDDAYYTKLRDYVATWRETHGHEYEAYELAERAFQGIAPRKVLSDMGQRMLDDAVLERVREGLNLPTRTAWAESRAKTRDSGAAA